MATIEAIHYVLSGQSRQIPSETQNGFELVASGSDHSPRFKKEDTQSHMETTAKLFSCRLPRIGVGSVTPPPRSVSAVTDVVASPQSKASGAAKPASALSIPVMSSLDIAPLLRLGATHASVRTADIYLPNHLDLTGIDLRWMYTASLRPQSWSSLRCGSDSSLECIDSPRSALALLRRGIRVSDLAPLDESAVRKRLSIEGISKESADLRVDFLAYQRSRLWSEALHEYGQLTRSISRNSVVNFVDAFISDNCNFARLPTLVPTGAYDAEGSPILEVVMTVDDRIAAALEGSRHKMEREQQNLKARADLENQNRSRVAEITERKALSTIAVMKRRDEQAKTRQSQRRDEAELRNLLSQATTESRQNARRIAEESARQAQQLKSARQDELENAMSLKKAQRLEARRVRIEEKKEVRNAKAAAARQAELESQQDLQARLAQAAQYAEELANKKNEENLLRRQTAVAKATQNNERRQHVKQRAEEILEAGRQGAEARQLEVERNLQEFNRRKTTLAQVARLREMKKCLEREDVAKSVVEVAQAALLSNQIKSEVQQRRFSEFRHYVQNNHEERAEHARESKLSKRIAVEQHERASEFSRFVTESRLATKTLIAEQVAHSRKIIVEQSTEIRNAVQAERFFNLRRATEEKFANERKTFFAEFEVTHRTRVRTRTPGPRSGTPAAIRSLSAMAPHPGLMATV